MFKTLVTSLGCLGVGSLCEVSRLASIQGYRFDVSLDLFVSGLGLLIASAWTIPRSRASSNSIIGHLVFFVLLTIAMLSLPGALSAFGQGDAIISPITHAVGMIALFVGAQSAVGR